MKQATKVWRKCLAQIACFALDSFPEEAAMPRIPNAELLRIKREVALAPLVSGQVKLTPRGKDLVGKCPFHDDDTASFVVTESKGLWHCFGCHAGGTAIDWIMKVEGFTFRDAADKLLLSLTSTVEPTLPALTLSPRMTDAELLAAVVDAYHAQLLALPDGLSYLTETRGLSLDVVKRFRLGYAPKSPALSSRLPASMRDELRARLQALGIIRETGREHLAGRVVVPFFDESGGVVGLYGRRTNATATTESPKHLYLPGPHRGVFNLDQLGSEVVLCESAIDALTFLSHGFTSVTASFGCEGFTDEMLAQMTKRGVVRVVIAYDHDEPGDHAADKLAQLLEAHGIESARALFPKTLDANAYALTMKPADKALRVVVDTAKPWSVEPPKRSKPFELSEPSIAPPVVDSPPAAAAPSAAEQPAPLPTPDVVVEEKGVDEASISSRGLRFRVRGLAKLASFDVLKVNLLIGLGDLFHVDTLDLYAAKARAFFVASAAHELHLPIEEIKAATGRLILALEELRDRRLTKATNEPPPMSDDEREEALALLKDERLIDHVVSDLAACGLVGEDDNKLLAYLAATSRKLPKPLAVMVQSSSAAGKSSLMDAVLAFIPDEDKVQYSAMTGQSLFYLGDADIKHKVLAIAEEEGAEQASYALKLLQSEGRLRIASTGKDNASGRHVTHTYEVEGPVAILSTTTAFDVDEELLNRCLVLTVDESAAQTAAIHTLQKQMETLEGVRRRRRRERLVTLHQNAQRLLHPIEVVNPLAPSLSFASTRTRARRDQPKLLSLIKVIAFLHQHQREVKRSEDGIDYIEATAADVDTARRLLRLVLDDAASELPPQTRAVLASVDAYVVARATAEGVDAGDVVFSRRELREATGLGDTQLKVHLGRLAELELLDARSTNAHRQRVLYALPRRTGRPTETGRAPVGNRAAPQSDRFLAPTDDKKSPKKPNRSGLNGNLFAGAAFEEPQARAAE
jgi:DNA primase